MSFSTDALVDIERSAPPPVAGFRFSGVAAGIKANGTPDLAVIVADAPCAAAGVFTRNRVRAAPVELATARVRKGRLAAVLVNSGNANACTGAAGMRAAEVTTRALAAHLGVRPELIAPASTGVIGKLLPTSTIVHALPSLLERLGPDASDFARAILTTDRWPKVAARTFRVARTEAVMLGIAKGAGMIHPDMATTLAFVVTDATIDPRLLREMLRKATDATFNAISVDGDTSTNDTIVALASGRSAEIRPASKAASAFGDALTDVLGALARSIVADGEGARHVVTLEISGGRTDEEARKAARAIATSPLVKTALHGRDANWGRILAAAGRSGAVFDPARARIRVGDIEIVRRGMAVGAEAEQAAARVMAEPAYTIAVSLGAGPGRARYLTCDLGPSYVEINANYRS